MSTARTTQNPWATCIQQRPGARLRLFCFPYVGGGTGVFRGWGELAPDIEVWAIQLPGRERRFAEPAIPSITGVADKAVDGLRPLFDAGPFAFFGHSMGALLAFELARRLRSRPPVKLVVSAHSAPQLGLERTQFRHRLPDAEFIAELKRLDGTPAEVLENRELLELVLPTLRADFQAVETYAYDREPQPPLACPLIGYGGTEDVNVPPAHVEAWGELTSGPFGTYIFPGGHFYLNTHRAELFAQLARDLRA